MGSVVHVGFSDAMGAFVVVNVCLLVILFILIILFVIAYGRRRYYDRIRLGSPKLSQTSRKKTSGALRWILRIILIILLVVALALLLSYLAKLGGKLILSAGGINKSNQSAMLNLTNITKTAKNSAQQINSSSRTNFSNLTAPAAAGAGTLLGGLKEFVLSYGGYAIVGFIILIILLSVLGSRKQN